MGTNKLKKNNNMYKIYKYGDKAMRRIQCGYGYTEYRSAKMAGFPKSVSLKHVTDCPDSPNWCRAILGVCWAVLGGLLLWMSCWIFMDVTHWWVPFIPAIILGVGMFLLWSLVPGTPGRKQYIVFYHDKRDLKRLEKRYVIHRKFGSCLVLWDKKR